MGEVKFVAVSDGVRLAAHVSGDGPPLYAIHGGPANDHTTFGDYLAPIASYRRLHMLDQRGCGRSDDAPVQTYTLERLAEDVEDVRRAEGHVTVDLLGHSFGGAVVSSYALRWPENVNTVVFVDTLIRGWRDILSYPAGWLLWARYALESRKEHPDWTTLQLKHEVANPAKRAEVGRLLHGPIRYDAARVTPLIRSASKRSVDIRPLIEAGTLVRGIYGKQDKRFLGGAMYLRSIGARVKIIRDSGHQPFIEQPDKFHLVLREFLVGTREPARA
jgi:pimeloyl-ACP methyl ester carboxylesterase